MGHPAVGDHADGGDRLRAVRRGEEREVQGHGRGRQDDEGGHHERGRVHRGGQGGMVLLNFLNYSLIIYLYSYDI